MNTLGIDHIPHVGKMVAFYADGSGCSLFKVHDGVLIDASGEPMGSVDNLQDMGYLYWMSVPGWYKFWSEVE